MARLLDGSSDLRTSAVTPVTAAPFTLGIWFQADDVDSQYRLFAIIGPADIWSMRLRGDVGGDPVQFQVREGGSGVNASSSTGFSANTWHHACAVERSTTDRSAYIDGGSRGNVGGTEAPASADEVQIGTIDGATRLQGKVAEAAIWNTDLDDPEVALLGLGLCPLFIRPANLVFYAPLIGRYNPEIDIMGSRNLTLIGTVVENHPRMIYPKAGLYPGIGGVAGPPEFPPALFAHARRQSPLLRM